MNTTKGTGKSRRVDDVESSDSDLSEGQLKEVKKQRAEAAKAAKAAKDGKNAESSASKKSVSGGSKKDKVSEQFTLCREHSLTCPRAKVKLSRRTSQPRRRRPRR